MIPVGELEIIIQLGVSLILGAIIGTERSLSGKTAGMRTFALVALGSTIFIIVARGVADMYMTTGSFDLLRVVSAVATGIGFIGAGLIIFGERNTTVRGLTTAAALWATAAIGVAVGFDMLVMAFIATILLLFTFRVLWWLEYVLHVKGEHTHIEEKDEQIRKL